jgi:putative transposase
MKTRPPRLRGFDYRAERTYFVTFCVARREPIFRSEVAARIAQTVTLDLRAKKWFWLYAYCIMPDHIHLVIKKAGTRSLQIVVGTLKRAIVLRCRESSLTVRWQWGFYDRIVREYELSDEFVTYVLMNPVRAGLVKDWRDYQFGGRLDAWK